MYYGVLIAMGLWLLAGFISYFDQTPGMQINPCRSLFTLIVLIVMGIVFGAIVELFQGTL